MSLSLRAPLTVGRLPDRNEAPVSALKVISNRRDLDFLAGFGNPHDFRAWRYTSVAGMTHLARAQELGRTMVVKASAYFCPLRRFLLVLCFLLFLPPAFLLPLSCALCSALESELEDCDAD